MWFILPPPVVRFDVVGHSDMYASGMGEIMGVGEILDAFSQLFTWLQCPQIGDRGADECLPTAQRLAEIIPDGGEPVRGFVVTLWRARPSVFRFRFIDESDSKAVGNLEQGIKFGITCAFCRPVQE